MAEVLDRGAGKGLLTHRHTLIGGLPPISRRPVRYPFLAALFCAELFFFVLFLAGVFAVLFLAALFLAVAFFAPRFFGAGPLARFSASSSAARSSVTLFSSSSLRRVALYSPSVT